MVRMRENRHTGFWWADPKERVHLLDLDANEEIILRWIHPDLRFGDAVGSCTCGAKISGSIKWGRGFLTSRRTAYFSRILFYVFLLKGFRCIPDVDMTAPFPLGRCAKTPQNNRASWVQPPRQ